jgi:hypothetical protein
MHLSTLAATFLLLGLTVTQGHAQGHVCCDLLIFEPASGESVSYAVKRRGGGAAIAEYSDEAGWRVIEGKAARRVLSDWSAASRREDTTSIFIDARDSDFHIGPWSPDIDAANEHTLILIHKASAGQARDFIADIDTLPVEQASRLRAVVPGK